MASPVSDRTLLPPTLQNEVECSNHSKPASTPVALLFFEQNRRETSIDYQDQFLRMITEKPWHRHIRAIAKSHIVDVKPLPPEYALKDSHFAKWANREIDVYVISHTAAVGFELSPATLARVNKIFLAMCDARDLARTTSSMLNKDVWAVRSNDQTAYLIATHVMGDTGDLIHFTKNLSEVASRVYRNGEEHTIPYSKVEILQDVRSRMGTCPTSRAFIECLTPLLNWDKTWDSYHHIPSKEEKSASHK